MSKYFWFLRVFVTNFYRSFDFNIVLIFVAMLLLFSPLSIAFTLPQLETNSQRFAFMIEIKKHIPVFFSNIQQKDVDRFSIMLNKTHLLSELEKYPQHLNKFDESKIYELKRTSTNDILIFMIELQDDKYFSVLNDIFTLDDVGSRISKENFNMLIAVLKKCNSTIEEWKNKIEMIAPNLLQYRPLLQYPTIMDCSDAFSKNNIEQTAKLIFLAHENIVQTNQSYNVPNEILKKINNTKAYGDLVERFLNNSKADDESTREQAVYVLQHLQAKGEKVLKAYLRALGDKSALVRAPAINALRYAKLEDDEIKFMQLELVKMLEDDNNSGLEAAFFILNNTILEEQTFLEIVKLLGKNKKIVTFLCDEKYKNKLSKKVLIQVANKLGEQESSDEARRVLEYHKPNDVEIQKRIAQLLTKEDAILRQRVIILLAFLKPKDPEVLNYIAKVLTDNNNEISAIAFRMIKEALQHPALAQNTELLKTINDAQKAWVNELLIPASQNKARAALIAIKPYEDAQLSLADLLTGDISTRLIFDIKIILKKVEQPSTKLIKKLEECSKNCATNSAAASEILVTFKSLN